MNVDKNFAVGCSILRFTRPDYPSVYIYNVICNYAGLYALGAPVYERGYPTSRCTTGRSRFYPGLCSTREEYDPNWWMLMWSQRGIPSAPRTQVQLPRVFSELSFKKRIQPINDRIDSSHLLFSTLALNNLFKFRVVTKRVVVWLLTRLRGCITEVESSWAIIIPAKLAVSSTKINNAILQVHKESQSVAETGLAHRTFVCCWPTAGRSAHKDVPPSGICKFDFLLDLCAEVMDASFVIENLSLNAELGVCNERLTRGFRRL